MAKHEEHVAELRLLGDNEMIAKLAEIGRAHV